MNQFKPGDKVRMYHQIYSAEGVVRKIGNCGYLDIAWVDGHDSLRGIRTFHPKQCELIEPKESELERLVRVANEGIDAFIKLAHEFERNVESTDGLPLKKSPAVARIRVKPKPAFEPFRVGTCDGIGDCAHRCMGDDVCPHRWLVRLEGDTLHVGCSVMKPIQAQAALKALCSGDESSYLVPNYKLVSSRQGIHAVGNSGTVGQLSWADADRILAALESAGVK